MKVGDQVYVLASLIRGKTPVVHWRGACLGVRVSVDAAQNILEPKTDSSVVQPVSSSLYTCRRVYELSPYNIFMS
jgi:hypothetical protein